MLSLTAVLMLQKEGRLSKVLTTLLILVYELDNMECCADCGVKNGMNGSILMLVHRKVYRNVHRKVHRK